MLRKFANAEDPEARRAFWQLIRYAIIGALITAAGQFVYWAGVEWFDIDPNVSIGIAFLMGVAVGFFAHGQISFAGHGDRGNQPKIWTRFILVNLFGFAMNSFFVWGLVKFMDGATWWPIVPNVVLTPLITFWMHRNWTYG